MGFFKRRQDEPTEVPCPNCQVLVSTEAVVCDVCGYDLRERSPDGADRSASARG
jgi:hypothetical protein